ncbi:MAG TPA: DUF5686 family protein [Cytophagaceae bacterium]
MRRSGLFTFILITTLLYFPILTSAQVHLLTGKVIDSKSKIPIPFVKLQTNHRDQLYLTDIEGKFRIETASAITDISAYHYLYDSSAIAVSDTTITIELVQNHFFPLLDSSSLEGKEIMNRVVKNKYINNPENYSSLGYTTYNKFTFSQDNVAHTNKILKKAFNLLGLYYKNIDSDQHLLIVESVTNRKYKNRFNQTEIIEGVKSSGITVPSLFIESSQVQAFSIYKDYVNVGGVEYISPLAEKRIFKRYAFQVIDTISLNNDTLFIISFNPRPGETFNGLKGFLYLNCRNLAVQFLHVSPAQGAKLHMHVAQSFKEYKPDFWLPERTQTVASFIQYGHKEFRLTVTGDTYLNNVEPNAYYDKKQFTETILSFDEHAEEREENYWEQQRITPLTAKDSNTYLYYNDIDKNRYLEKVLKLGEKIYYGDVPFKFLTFELNKLFNVNEVEELRLGLGFRTNNLFSERYSIGAFAGYGIRDQKIKGGVKFNYLIEPVTRLTYHASVKHDLTESGAAEFKFDNFQYSSEVLRKYLLRIMDRTSSIENSLTVHPLKYLDVAIFHSLSKSTPTYTYYFKDTINSTFNFSEFGAGLRFAFGEQIIELAADRKKRINKYPILYLNYIKGLDGLLGDYAYNKIDIKVEKTFRIHELGVSGIQLAAGSITGNAPYMKLNNGKGSYKPFSVVVHNSFETMAYNEFLSDKYCALFISHSFGRLHFKNPRYRPSLIILHNIGFGKLSNPEFHRGLEFKTMEKGFFESGAFMDNVLVVNIAGLKTGLGAGIFVRYGPYSLPAFEDNFVFKISTNFSL